MRLKQIKLAGFKSFVDPTLAPFPDNLTAIVGPNGCGKSNIIDAVRWVMGESSAKHLRGDSMSDVIFNGSSARKPVALASVELVFDNSEGKLQGEYTNYNEISTKRQVTREGQSSYFLNGARCRRKDITDIFLGTGLGPRSYAIIEQGMISRLIESKPQELRVFIEEAAGISKYKERRRETENRIRHTKDNLDRLSDLREELGSQLERLQRQANAARKFKEFKSDERRLKAELAAIRWQQLNSTYTEGQRHLQNLELEYEAKTTEQRSIDARLEASREEHRELNDALNEVQARFYRIGADISRFEQGLEHIKSRKAQINDDLAQAATAQQHAESHQTIDKEKVDELLLELEELEPQLMELEDVIDSSNDELSTLESEMNDWQAEWENYNKNASENKKKAEVLQTRISHSETIMTRIQHRVVKLEEERLAIESEESEDDEAVREAAEELEITKLSAFEAQQQVEQIYENLEEKRAVLKEKNQKLSHLQKSVNALRSRKISIEALQNAALNDKSSNTLAWIDECNLDNAPRLAQLLDVEPEWTTAVESVLSEELDSICVSSVEAYLEKIQDDLSVQLFDTQVLEEVSGKTAGSLREKIKNDFQFPADLSSIKVAHTLPEAIEMRGALQAGESVVTKDGIWLGPAWIKVKSADSGTNGVLERANELKVVTEELAAAESDAQQQQGAIESLSDALLVDENNWRESQNKLNETNQQYAKLQTVVGTQQAKIEQLKKRKQRVLQEIDDNGGQLDEEQEILSTYRMELEGIVDLMSDDIGRQESLQEKKEEKRTLLDDARQKVRDQKEQQHRLHLRAESIKTELNTTKKQQQRSQEQLIQLNERIQSLTVILEENEEAVPELEENLEEALESRVAVEEELTVSKEKADQTEQILRQLEKDRTSYEQSSQDIRGRLEKCRLECQGLLMQKGTQEEQIKELDVDLTQLLDNLPENSNEKEWVSQLDRMSGKIQRLGAINLAAIEEYESQSQRKEYLDAQNDDLLSALETLENAIRKIDKETRDRFKDTFDKVNDGIQELFPKVFGGGHAYLELTGDDLLDTGVAIMARPPGKKNSTIHLLSGGEKALTALSLVFSIFRLNPAPFCLLDEVDAPLDDANVNRFCKLVKEMSKQVQFIFISHNKVAMEMANHMQGVTMHEPGVSRLVSVDIDEAASLVNA